MTVWDGVAVLEVEDDNGGRPDVRHTTEADEAGRGLILVRALADRWVLAIVEAVAHSWGWEAKRGGKAVQFLVVADAVPARDRRLSPPVSPVLQPQPA